MKRLICFFLEHTWTDRSGWNIEQPVKLTIECRKCGRCGHSEVTIDLESEHYEQSR